MNNFLKKIIIEKQREVGIAKAIELRESITERLSISSKVRSFKDCIRRANSIKLIAEIKYSSPSRGAFGCGLRPERLAKIYEGSGASAISVLTDRGFFGGDILHLSIVKEACSLPVLRKDFIIDEYQVYESKAFGADAILLIPQILPEKRLNQLYSLAGSLGMDIMVEVHSESDLRKAIAIRPDIIGINNRDLKTFRVDLKVTERLIKKIPEDIIKVSESGIRNYKDVQYLRKLGIDAVLVGEIFVRSKDIAKKVRDLMAK